jgi:hypothetical protein
MRAGSYPVMQSPASSLFDRRYFDRVLIDTLRAAMEDVPASRVASELHHFPSVSRDDGYGNAAHIPHNGPLGDAGPDETRCRRVRRPENLRAGAVPDAETPTGDTHRRAFVLPAVRGIALAHPASRAKGLLVTAHPRRPVRAPQRPEGRKESGRAGGEIDRPGKARNVERALGVPDFGGTILIARP